MSEDPPFCIVVAVSSDGRATDVVRAGASLARALSADWQAVHIETDTAVQPGSLKANQALALASQLGAFVVRLPGSSVADGLCRHIEGMRRPLIVLGHRVRSRWSLFFRNPLQEQLRSLRPDADLHLVQSAASPRRVPDVTKPSSFVTNLLKTVVAVIVTAFLALTLNWLLGIRSLSLIFLLPVITAAARWGLLASILAALLSALAFNLLFLEPVYEVQISAPQSWFMAGVLLVAAIYTSLVTAALRSRLSLSDRSAKESAAIATFAQELARVADWRSTAETVCDQLAAMFSLNVMLLREVEGRLIVEAANPRDLKLSPVDWAAVDWTWSQGEAAGIGTPTLSAVNWQFQPLCTSLGLLAVVGVARSDGRNPIAPEQKLMFETMLAQAALAHERLRLEAAVREEGQSQP